ncbi:MAG: radical SAM family heme chaperone HemW [Spirochaetaceae bacterium]|nr:radical SAM family heme chaperone HemW [Spirochaetaceae bacterium]
MGASVYIHIPFCKSKCTYCDFFSVVCTEPVPDSYIENVLNEAVLRKEEHKILSCRTLYIGGGTPSLLTPSQIKKLLAGLQTILPFEQDAEVTMEANPDDITQDLLLAAADSGVNRLSVGIQAMDDKPLSVVKRRCTRKTNTNALNLIQKYWLPKKLSFSVDCIAGLPEQTEQSFKTGFKELIQSGANHISLYTLTLEEGTLLYKEVNENKITLSPDFADDLWLWGRDFLEQNGFAQYEVSNFARTGFECRHNLTYWNLQDYVGLGAGATGMRNNIRYTNSRNLNKWGLRQDTEIEELSQSTLIFEYLMMGFRKLSGIDSRDFFRRFGESVEKYIEPLFGDWVQKKLAVCKNGRYSFNRDGILFLNSFLTALLEQWNKDSLNLE